MAEDPSDSPAQRDAAQTGRKLGPRALRTRARLLEATQELLKTRSVLDVSVVEIARQADTSPATFYHYFKDVEEAVLLLAEQAAEELPEVLDQLGVPWLGEEGLSRARTVVSAFIDHWDQHHAVLLMRNLAADKGDERFQAVRRNALTPVLDQMAARIEEAQAAGRVDVSMHPFVAAAAMAALLERLSAHYRDLRHVRASREEFVETCAQILFRTLAGDGNPKAGK